MKVDPAVPFDSSKHVIPNTRGKVEGIPGLYCSGWIKRGPVGVIVATMNDSFETAETILRDIQSGVLDVKAEKPLPGEILGVLKSRHCDPVSFAEWETVDKEELERGLKNGKLREKIVDVRETIAVAKGVPLEKLKV